MERLRRERLRASCCQAACPSDSLALKRFGGYAPDVESRRLEFSKTSSFIDKFLPIWSSVDLGHYDTEDRYNACMLRVRGIRATSEDLAALLVALTSLAEQKDFLDKTGFFISALMNCGKEPRYSLDLTMLQYGPIPQLGFMNNKEIEIFGDVGDEAGALMRRGSLIIHGDAEDRIAWGLKGGDVHVFGNAEDFAGEAMSGGRLMIEEGAGNQLGHLLCGGIIHVEGDVFGAIADGMNGGKIIIDGKIAARRRAGKDILVVRNCDRMCDGEVHMNGNYVAPRGIAGGKVFHKGRQMWPEKG
jgi:hypothetical protein